MMTVFTHPAVVIGLLALLVTVAIFGREVVTARRVQSSARDVVAAGEQALVPAWRASKAAHKAVFGVAPSGHTTETFLSALPPDDGKRPTT